MRQVTKHIVNSFLSGQRDQISNSMTDGKSLYLWGNEIARFNSDGKLEISLCGYNTVTTRERLNGVLSLGGYNLRVSSKNFTPMINGVEISSNRYYVIDTL